LLLKSTQHRLVSTSALTQTLQFQSFKKMSADSATSALPKILFVLGGPGAGKGTQCTKIVQVNERFRMLLTLVWSYKENLLKNFGFVHLSAGDLLRAERARPGSKVGELIEDYIRKGTIVPVEITCTILENVIIDSKHSVDKNKT